MSQECHCISDRPQSLIAMHTVISNVNFRILASLYSLQFPGFQYRGGVSWYVRRWDNAITIFGFFFFFWKIKNKCTVY